jgi:hypothetical protein
MAPNSSYAVVRAVAVDVNGAESVYSLSGIVAVPPGMFLHADAVFDLIVVARG